MPGVSAGAISSDVPPERSGGEPITALCRTATSSWCHRCGGADFDVGGYRAQLHPHDTESRRTPRSGAPAGPGVRTALIIRLATRASQASSYAASTPGAVPTVEDVNPAGGQGS